MSELIWLQLILEAAPGQAETLSEQLTALGALSVCLQDAADEPLYEPALNTTPLWAHTVVIGLFEGGRDMQAVVAGLGVPLPPYRVQVLEDEDWVRRGTRDFHPLRFGERLWICPSWEAPPQLDALNIFLDPGLAFGTGAHPTTALCLEWLDAQQDLRAKRCIDYGCGSGILALAAVKLGASQVWAVDNDPQALLATRDNALKNVVAEGVILPVLPKHLPPMQADILLANILANPLRELAAHFARHVRAGGWVVLSGILSGQSAEVAAAYAPYFDLAPTVERDGWARLSGRRKEC